MTQNKETSRRIGANIKNARKLKKITQVQMAKKFKMTQAQYSRFETGKFELNYQQIIDICDTLEVTPNDIFEYER